ncbi:hypothetical protein F4805DRAFT_416109 [Annulohypoxylon moriforme]|nr:hypothetical protein F4805DRAFT_416109 [Annulohypoxylon moriforme]
MSSSSPVPSKSWNPILCETECYCAICGVSFGPFLWKNENQINRKQGPYLIDGVEYGYSPKKVGGFANIAWLKTVFFVCYIEDINETIMSGPARFTAPEVIELFPHDKRNEAVPYEFEYVCYKVTEGKVTVHPFHWPCFEILARVLFPNSADPTHLVNLGDLDSTFASLSNGLTGLNESEISTGGEKRHGKQ